MLKKESCPAEILGSYSSLLSCSRDQERLFDSVCQCLSASQKRGDLETVLGETEDPGPGVQQDLLRLALVPEVLIPGQAASPVLRQDL